MILHRVTLRDFRGIEERDVHFEESGVHVIEGPNEVGKSSIFEALDLLFNLKSSSNHNRVKAVVPVSRDAGPFVEAEFTVEDRRLVYRKRWQKKHITELEFPDSVTPSLSSGEAHDYVTQMLADKVDMALWSALQISQDEEISQLNAGESLVTLHKALDAAAEGSNPTGDDDLIAKVRTEAEKYWTPKDGSPKASLKSSDKRLVEAREGVEEAERRRAEIEKRVEDHDFIAHTLAEKRKKVAEFSKDRERLQEGQALVTELADEVEKSKSRAHVASVEAGAVERRAEDRRALVAAIAELENELAVLTASFSAAEAAAEETDDTWQAAQRKVSAAEEDSAAARARLESARASTDRRRAVSERDELREQVRELERIDTALETVETQLGQLAVEDDLRGDLEAATDALRAVEIGLRASAPTVEIEGEGEVRVGEETVSAAGGWSGEIVDITRFGVGDVGIVVTPAGDTESIRAEHVDAERRLTEVLDRVGAASVDEVEERIGESERLGRDARELRAQRVGMLGSRTPEEVRNRLAGLEEFLGEAMGEQSEDETDPETAAATVQELETALSHARIAEREAAGAHRETERERDRLGVALDSKRTEHSRRSEDLVAARADAMDDEIEGALAEHKATVERSERELRDLEERYEEAARKAPPEEFDHVVKVIDGLESEIVRLSSEVSEAKAALEVISGQGRQSALDEALTHLSEVESEHAALFRRARAAKVLLDALENRRAETLLRYQAPFREKVVELGSIVFGDSFDVELGDDLTITHRKVGGETVPYSSLSSGAREQLAIIVRVACAQLVGDGGVPVFLDDTLGYTDPSRRRGMGQVLSRCGVTSQVVVLTCDSGRFDEVAAPQRIRLV